MKKIILMLLMLSVCCRADAMQDKPKNSIKGRPTIWIVIPDADGLFFTTSNIQFMGNDGVKFLISSSGIYVDVYRSIENVPSETFSRNLGKMIDNIDSSMMLYLDIGPGASKYDFLGAYEERLKARVIRDNRTR